MSPLFDETDLKMTLRSLKKSASVSGRVTLISAMEVPYLQQGLQFCMNSQCPSATLKTRRAQM